jgi:hypothetical protein
MNSQHVTISGYSLWPKYLSGQAISEIINSSHSEECNEISDSESFSEHFCFSGSSSISSEEEISLSWSQARVMKEH